MTGDLWLSPREVTNGRIIACMGMMQEAELFRGYQYPRNTVTTTYLI
jgi:hypothetical protein